MRDSKNKNKICFKIKIIFQLKCKMCETQGIKYQY